MRSIRPQAWQRQDKRWEGRIVSGNGKILFTTHVQGYERKAGLFNAFEAVGIDAGDVEFVEGP